MLAMPKDDKGSDLFRTSPGGEEMRGDRFFPSFLTYFDFFYVIIVEEDRLK